MTLLIRNVRIVGGEREYPGSVDVFITGDRISAIGNFPTKGADQILDGQGAYLSPGFIDVNTDSDHYLSLFEHPAQEDFLRQGVTTIIGGNCGSSLAPLIYGSLESVQKWGDISKVNIDWHTMEEFLAIFEKRPLAVNFGTLVGHATIRRAIVGDDIRDLTKNELAVLSETLRNAIKEGGLGVSAGLGYVHGARTPYSELKAIAAIAKEYNGVYSAHLPRSGHEILESVEETIKLTKETGVKTEISHLMPVQGFEKQYDAVLQKIDGLPREIDLNFDIYPSDTMVFPIYTFLPEWAKSGLETMVKTLSDDWGSKRILKDLPEVRPDDFILAQAPGNEFLIGRSLRELTAIYNVADHREALVRLMVGTGLRAVVFYKTVNYDLVRKAILGSRAFIASNAASYPYSGKALKPERAVATFPKFLEMIVRGRTMSLETAIRKITSEPAAKFGITERGLLKEGNFADLALFAVDEKAETYGKCIEIKGAIVNGQLVMQEGVFKGQFPGKALKHKG
ncbi:MAG: hypothetical protein AAB897_00585 [Patescibacteria group bacterium]